ncbi:MAG: TetR/AcrR family transcriptional regulator [Methylobacteriaceae bacterium]|nr:TetR/AcrR family transcriptional regulator [Methylobacteriaceae bacterium]
MISRKSGRPTHQQSADLTDRILDAAERSFVERGFQGTTIKSVAEDCRVTRRSVVSRYKSRDELLVAVALREMETFAPQLHGLDIREAHRWEDLEALIRKLCERGANRRNAALLRAYLGEIVRLPHLARSIMAFYSEISAAIEQKIAMLQTFGMFGDYKASTVAASVISLVISNPRIRTMLFDPTFEDPAMVERYFTDAWTLIREMA